MDSLCIPERPLLIRASHEITLVPIEFIPRGEGLSGKSGLYGNMGTMSKVLLVAAAAQCRIRQD